MTTRYAVASGNWSSTATWDGGTLPASGDNVYANGNTVAIDQDVTFNVLSVASNSSPAVTAGGKFTVAAARTITGTVLGNLGTEPANSVIIEVSATTGTVTVNGTVQGGATCTAISLLSGANCTLTVNGGDIIGATTSTGKYAIACAAASATLNLNGANIQAALSLSSSSAAVNITPINQLKGGYGLHGVWVQSATGNTPHITVTGKVTGDMVGGATAGHGICVTGTDGSPVILVTGTVAGGQISSAGAVSAGIAYSVGSVLVDGVVDYFNSFCGQPPFLPTSQFVDPVQLKNNANAKFNIHDETDTALTLANGGGGGGSVRPATGYQWPRTR